MKITHEAMELLAIHNGSCRTFKEKKIKNLKYLVECAKSGDSLDFDEFISKLPEKSDMYVLIKGATTLLGKEEIDRQTLLNFFGGRWHVEHVLDQIRFEHVAKKEGQEFADKLLFAHLLTPVVLDDVRAGHIAASYHNKDVTVKLQNLIVHPWVKKALVPGKMVLVHYAVIVDANPSLEEIKFLLEEQSARSDFMDVIGLIKKIDFEKFWNLKTWTEDLLEESLK